MTITLIPTTKQEAFDSVWNQLKTQPRRSFDEGANMCMYRESGNASDSVRCAIGGMIPDAQYVKDIECISIGDLISDVVVVSNVDAWFLNELQSIHDSTANWEPEGFNRYGRAALRSIAEQYELEVPA